MFGGGDASTGCNATQHDLCFLNALQDTSRTLVHQSQPFLNLQRRCLSSRHCFSPAPVKMCTIHYIHGHDGTDPQCQRAVFKHTVSCNPTLENPCQASTATNIMPPVGTKLWCFYCWQQLVVNSDGNLVKCYDRKESNKTAMPADAAA